jgi:two-component system chemotaxis response regulator CheB
MNDDGEPLRVIGIAASAGGIEPLRRIVSELPAGLPAAVCVVLHIPATGRSLLAPILDRGSGLRAVPAEHGQRLERGTIYVAPADHHLLVREATIELSRGPKENGVRPAADPLFRSLASAWGRAAIGVVLSGALDDGAAGIAALAAAGGTVVVQDPADALVSGMPDAALAAAAPDHVLPAAAIGALLTGLVDGPGPAQTEQGAAPLRSATPSLHEPERPSGPPSGFTCPECGGALWEQHGRTHQRYRCRVGHAYSEDAMVEAQGEAVEAALWTALEVLEERGELLTRIAGRLGAMPRSEGRFRNAARDVDDRAALIRRALGMGSGDRELSMDPDEVQEARG